jgi:hypothetical protein
VARVNAPGRPDGLVVRGLAMVGNASKAWSVLKRVLDSLLSELSDDDLDRLHQAVEAERYRRLQQRRQNPEVINP